MKLLLLLESIKSAECRKVFIGYTSRSIENLEHFFSSLSNWLLDMWKVFPFLIPEYHKNSYCLNGIECVFLLLYFYWIVERTLFLVNRTGYEFSSLHHKQWLVCRCFFIDLYTDIFSAKYYRLWKQQRRVACDFFTFYLYTPYVSLAVTSIQSRVVYLYYFFVICRNVCQL